MGRSVSFLINLYALFLSLIIIFDFSVCEFFFYHSVPFFHLLLIFRITPTFYLLLGRSLLPHSTILCRIDTLEKPLLLPRCLGYAVLKVFVSPSGLQPVAAEAFDADSFLNSGEFSLPIYYGRIPDGQLREDTIVETMNPISGAFLRVCLFDSRYQVDTDSRWTWKSKSSLGTGTTGTKMTKDADEDSDFGSARTHQPEPTQGVTVVESVLQCAQSLQPGQALQHPIPLNPNHALRVLYSREPHANSRMEASSREQLQILQQRNHRRMEVIEIVARYVEALFPRLDEIKTVVNPTYIMNYEDSVGSLLSLDMLYNMPNRRNLIRAADESTIVQAIRQGLSSGWDNKIKYFKTVFRYLPGTSDEEFENTNKEASKEFVLDDASVRPVLTSHELSPMYVDDFSCTASLRLTARACLLIQVTAVDVLTSSKVSNVGGNLSKDLVSAAHFPGSPQRSRQNSLTGEEIGDVNTGSAKKSERLSKLKGLIGIYIGHNDVESTWWGILPLQTTYTGPHPGDASDIPFFAHAGTHLVPLFKGLPPEALIVAADPMQWLLSALKVQRRAKRTSSLYYTIFSKLAWKEKKKDGLKRSSSVPSMLPSSAMGDSGDESPQSLLLCKGSSAVVRLVDARLKKTANSPIAHDASICPSHKTLSRILRAYCSNEVDEVAEPAAHRITTYGNSQASIYEDTDNGGAVDERKFNRNFARFSYNALRNMEDRTILACIPSTIEPDALIQEINQQFYQTVE